MPRKCQELTCGFLVAVTLVSGALATAAVAQDSSSSSRGLSKLAIHGYLTQAYADAKFATGGFPDQFPHPDEKTLGVPENGTFDYNNLAIQFRYEITAKDIMIIQLSSRSLATSPIETAESEIELDWAFYERRLGDQSTIKIGRVQIPFGIYNEIRDVGTILPFYRPSFVFYREGSFTSETVDGVVLSHTFFAGSDWTLDADFYFGSWDLVEIEPFFGDDATLGRARDGIGIWLWLNTSVPGLRFGFGGHQENLTQGQPAFRAPGESTRQRIVALSADLTLDKFTFKGEINSHEFGATSVLFGSDFTEGYVQFGFLPTEKFRIYLQGEFGENTIDKDEIPVLTGLPVTEDPNFDFRTDYGIALNYLFAPNLVLKLEHHITEHVELAFAPVFAGPGPPVALRPIFATADDGAYTILSFSASF